MYNYLLFVLIGILLFLLFNNKNKFSIGFPDHSDSSQSGESVEDDRPQITASVNTDVLTRQQLDDQTLTQDDGVGILPGMLSFSVLDPKIFIPSCAAAGLLGAVALRRGRNPRQQLPQSDIETGDP